MRALAFALLLSGVLAAQTRKAVVGRVLDLSGQPVARASVTMFWTAPGDTLGERTDKIEVATDEHGRFVAQLLPQRGYSAFATSPAGTSPRMVSVIRDGLAAGADLELHLDQAAVHDVLELRGGDAWQQPLRVVALPAARNLLPIALELRDNLARLPAVDVLKFAVLDARGRPLWTGHGTKNRGRYLDLPPPFDLRFRVVDEKGAPVEGAQVVHVMPTLALTAQMPVTGSRTSVLRELGKTDADGRLTAIVPAAADPWRADPAKGLGADLLTFLATRPGRGTAVAALGGNICQCNGAPMEPPADRVLPMILRAQMRMRLSPPLPEVEATLTTSLRIPVEMGSIGHQWTLPWRTDADGWFELPLPDENAGGLLEMEGAPLRDGTTSPRCVLEIAAGPDQRSDLTKLRRLSVQVLGADAGPARGLPVLLRSHSQRRWEVKPAFTDQAGRVQFQVGPGDWLVFVDDGQRAVWRSLRDGDAGGDWRLLLQPLPTMVCRLVDADGKPLAGASLGGVSSKPTRTPANGEEQCLYSLTQTFLHRQRLSSRSGADGMIRLAMLGDYITWQLRFAKGNLTSSDVTWRAGEEAVSVPLK